MSETESIEKLHVQIGQVKTGQAGQSLNAILGSCIGLAFLCPAKGLYGLAHCLLSKADVVRDEISARHIDQAIHSLCHMMALDKRSLRNVQVVVAGGANMTLPEDVDPKRLVGKLNAEFAYETLKASGVRQIHRDVGGTHGRQIAIDCNNGTFKVISIPRLGAQQ